MQQSPLWCKRLQYIPATALPEQCRPDVVLAPQIRSYHSVLKDLHWLPVEQRIEYKVLLLTYKALHGKAPAYISQLLSLYTPTRPLRSENKNLLRVPRCRLEGFGRGCFAYAAPSLWNPLPTPVKRASSIDTFKSSLKTCLFNVAYPSINWILYCMSILFVTHFLCFLFTSAFEHGDFSPFFKLALYKCNIIIIIIIMYHDSFGEDYTWYIRSFLYYRSTDLLSLSRSLLPGVSAG